MKRNQMTGTRILEFERRRRLIYGPVNVMHARSNGGPVLKGESSWRTINGVLINTRFGWLMFLFRRRYKPQLNP